MADFSTSTTEAIPLEIVAFTDLSSGDIACWSWDFGDGNTAGWAAESRPEAGIIRHIYPTAGIYTISLEVSNSVTTDTAATTITIVTIAEANTDADTDTDTVTDSATIPGSDGVPAWQWAALAVTVFGGGAFLTFIHFR